MGDIFFYQMAAIHFNNWAHNFKNNDVEQTELDHETCTNNYQALSICHLSKAFLLSYKKPTSRESIKEAILICAFLRRVFLQCKF